jgi:hypothetical protein
MGNQAQELSSRPSDLSGLFDLKGDGYRGASRLKDFELREEEVYWWRMPRTHQVSLAMRSGNVRVLSRQPLSHPFELFRILGSHALAARSLTYKMRPPAFWVRQGGKDASERGYRPALPETQLSELLEVPTRQVRPALRPLLEDGAVELVRSPAGVRAILVLDGFFDEYRLRARLRA